MSARLLARLALLGVAGSLACSSSDVTPPPAGGPQGESDHSSSIAVSTDGATVYVVNADADSVSFVDARARTLIRETPLSSAPPAVDGAGRYEPAVGPRALALGPGGKTLYVTGERNGHVYALDTASGAITADADTCSEPIGVLAAPDGKSVYVACSQDDAVLALDATTLAVTARVDTPRKPWTLAWSADRSQIYVTHLLGPGVSVLAPSPLALQTTWAVADGPPGADPTVPHGESRGLYDVLARPGTTETWALHMMLGTDTPQPTLDFQRTVFPAISLFDAGGAPLARLTVSTAPKDGGAFGDVVSGPRAIAFSADGKLAFVADTGSEDVLVVDADKRVEVALVRPLPGHQPEGVAVSADGHVYVDERNTSDVAVLAVSGGEAGPVTVTVDGAAIPRLAKDPMPADLRLGQHVFFSAQSDELPVTTDHWVSCASCHLEGRSDAVTWRFGQGPRDTPSNAGGTKQTGFLFRTGARNKVQDYWQTINVEQGGHFDPNVPALSADLDALEKFVDYALPYPSPPRGLDPGQVAHGKDLFGSLGCASCHSGAAFTDSGAGNATLDLSGPVLLHDVGTCVTSGPWVDVAVDDEEGHPRGACAFDTPSLRGLSDSAPYLHDGSAATLQDVLKGPAAHVGDATKLSADDAAALVAYLRSL